MPDTWVAKSLLPSLVGEAHAACTCSDLPAAGQQCLVLTLCTTDSRLKQWTLPKASSAVHLPACKWPL